MQSKSRSIASILISILILAIASAALFSSILGSNSRHHGLALRTRGIRLIRCYAVLFNIEDIGAYIIANCVRFDLPHRCNIAEMRLRTV